MLGAVVLLLLLALCTRTGQAQSFAPTFSSGSLDVFIGGAPPVSTTNVVTIPTSANLGTVNNVTNPVLVHFTASFERSLQALTVSLRHNGVTVRLFSLDSTRDCDGFFQQNRSTIIFADNANLPFSTVDCSTGNVPQLQQGETYFIRPQQSLSAFNGQSYSGDWTIIVSTAAVANGLRQPTAADLASRSFRTWGLTVSTKTCAANQYLLGTSVSTGVCTACPANSMASAAGLGSLNSCPCLAGYDSSVVGACSNCALNSYRALSPVSSPVFQQQRGVASCIPCRSSTSFIAAISASQCQSDCDPGYYYPGSGACLPCDAGSYKAVKSSAACTSCGTGRVTVGGPNVLFTSPSQCLCDRGFDSTTNTSTCTACLPNSFKDFIGAGVCTACGVNAQAVSAGSSMCVCKSGFAQYSSSPMSSGADCVPIREWKASAWSSCSATCDGGIQTRTFTCADATGALFDPATFCPGAFPGATSAACNTAPCLANAYSPSFGTKLINTPFRWNAVTNSSFTVPDGLPLVSNHGSSPLAVVVNIRASYRIDQIRLTVTHNSSSAITFDMSGAFASCTTGTFGGANGAQLVFSTLASDLQYCDSTAQTTFQDSQTYSFYPFLDTNSNDFFTALDGNPAGVWTLTIDTTTSVPDNAATANNLLVSWGITLNPTTCAQTQFVPSSQFVSGGRLDSGVCATCPQVNPGSSSGLQTVNSAQCACLYGADASAATTSNGLFTIRTSAPSVSDSVCAQCAATFYRPSTAFAPQYLDVYGATQCTPCYAPSNVDRRSCQANNCNAGYIQNTADLGGACVPCSIGFTKATAGNAASCISCPSIASAPAGAPSINFGSLYPVTLTTASTGSTNPSTDCVCPAGFEGTSVSGSCVPCVGGLFKAGAGNGLCSACVGNSVPSAVVGSKNCTCLPGYFDYSSGTQPNGASCQPARFWKTGDYGTCSNPCNGGVATRDVYCSDVTGARFSDNTCNPAVKPLSSQPCNTQVCTPYGYTPQYDSGMVNTLIPVLSLANTATTVVPSAAQGAFVTSINVPTTAATVNNVAVHVTLGDYAYLGTLKLAITHGSVTVPLFSIASASICGDKGKVIGPSQITFADGAGLPQVTCSSSPASYPVFQAGETIVVPAVGMLSAFNGMPLTGSWTLTAWATNLASIPAALLTRNLLSFGISNAATTCLENEYTPPPTINSGTCNACPANSAAIVGGVNSINSCPCLGGFDASTPFSCTACPINTYRELVATTSASNQQLNGQVQCVNCNSNTVSTASSAFAACDNVCFPGFYAPSSGSDPTCIACPAGSHKSNAGGLITGLDCETCPTGYADVAGLAECKPCAAHTVQSADRRSCRCAPGYADYSSTFNPSGANCVPVRFWAFDQWQACSSRCEFGMQFRNVYCKDSTGAAFAESSCDASSRPSNWQACNTDTSCLAFGFVPEFASGYLGTSSPVAIPVGFAARVVDTVIVPSTYSGTVSASFPVAVHFTARFPSMLQQLRVRLTHNGITSDLFNLNSAVPCLGGLGTTTTGSSLVFSDGSTLPSVASCNNANILNFNANEAYIVPPVSALTAFANTPAAGNWTIEVWSRTGLSLPTEFVSWGVTFNPITVAANQYAWLYLDRQRATASTCPSNSVASVAGVNGINSCPCRPGFDASVIRDCTACPTNQYRQANQFQPLNFQQSQNVSGCLPCHSQGNSAAVSLALSCSSQCDAGYYFNPNYGCVACPVGYYKVGVGASNSTTAGFGCMACPIGSTTLSSGASSLSQCVCDRGNELFNGVCTPCRRGSYKNTIDNGSCSLCSVTGTSTVGATRCTCLAGTSNSNTNLLDGSACVPVKQWAFGKWDACTSQCEKATQTRSIYCVDIRGNTYPLADCPSALQPATTRPCPVQSSCTTNGFAPQFAYATGPIGANEVSTPSVGASSVMHIAGSGRTLTASDVLAVHISFYTTQPATGGFSIRLTRGSTTVTLASNTGGAGACGVFGAQSSSIRADGVAITTATQLIFSDKGATTLPCGGYNLASGESYSYAPVQSLATGFTGVSLDGDWTLQVATSSGNTGSIVSWGFTLNPSVCGANQFVMPGSTHLFAACSACPTNSTAIQSGSLNTINNCQCQPGYDTSVPYQCTICPHSTYRSAFAQQQGVSQCIKCFSYAPAGSNGPNSCETNCWPGYYNVPSGGINTPCQACPLHYYKDTSGPQACTACSLNPGTDTNVVTLAPAASSIQQCLCIPGTHYDSTTNGHVTCTPCLVNEYMANYNTFNATTSNKCALCDPVKGKSLVGSSACSCKNPTFTDYSSTKDGSGCISTLGWVPSGFGGCSVDFDIGVQTQTVVCQDAAGVVYPDSVCNAIPSLYAQVFPVPLPNLRKEQVCLGNSGASMNDRDSSSFAVASNYPAQFQSKQQAQSLITSVIPANDPVILGLGAVVNPNGASGPINAIQLTAFVDRDQGVVSASNPVIAHFTGAFSGRLNNMNVWLHHDGVYVNLFSVPRDVSCTGQFGGQANPADTFWSQSQIVFGDDALLPAPDCTPGNQPNFQYSEAYIIRPTQALSAFYGMPSVGEWTFIVFATPGAVDETTEFRFVQNVGVTFNPVKCPINGANFLSTGLLLAPLTQYDVTDGFVATCSYQCASNSLPFASNPYATSGSLKLVGRHSCPCQAGYSTRQLTAGSVSVSQNVLTDQFCTKCAAGSYKPFADPYGDFKLNDDCISCNTLGNTVASVAPVSIATGCTSQNCNSGFYFASTTLGCVACRIGTYRVAGTSTASCTSCPSGFTTTFAGADSAVQCKCPIGYGFNSGSCTLCSSNSFKSSVDNNACTAIPSNSVALADRSNFQCNTGYFRLGAIVACYPTATWVYSAWTSCSTTCNGGTQTRTLSCYSSGIAPTSYGGSSNPFTGADATAYCGAPDIIVRQCAPTPCINPNNGYASSFGAGLVNSPLVANTPFTSTVTVSSAFLPSGSETTVSATNPIVIEVTGRFPTFAGVSFTLVKGSQSITFYNGASSTCTASAGSSTAPAQLLFSDDSAGSYQLCDLNTQGAQLLADQSYSFRPNVALSSFIGSAVAGNWQLIVNSPVAARLVSWGITFKPYTCLNNEYSAPPTLTRGCYYCSNNSITVTGGINTPNSCPCMAGFEAAVFGICTPCARGTFRSIVSPSLNPAVFQSPQGVPSCLACNGDTTSVGSTSAASCTADCKPGFFGTGGAVCQACPIGTYQPLSTGPAVCIPCNSILGNSTTIFAASSASTDCRCSAGYTWNPSAGCVACVNGQFKSAPGNNTCSSCVGFSSSPNNGVGQAACSCLSGYTDYSPNPNPNGSGCTRTVKYATTPTLGPCAGNGNPQDSGAPTFLCDALSQTTSYACQFTDNTPANGLCGGILTPPAKRTCSASTSDSTLAFPCLSGAFVPEWGSGFLGSSLTSGAVIPVGESTYSFQVYSNDIISRTNQVAVLINLQYWFYLNTLTLTIEHEGVSVQLFNTGSDICYGFIAGSQMIFSDSATLPAATCSNENIVTFQANLAYATLPKSALSAFYGKSAGGTWTLRVNAAAAPFPVQFTTNTRTLMSFGVTFNPTVCPANQFISAQTSTPSLKGSTSACTACPDNAYNATAGLNTFSSCPCRAGYRPDYGSVESCVACPANTFRSISPFSPYYTQMVSSLEPADSCFACGAVTPASPEAAASASSCGTNCLAGYEPTFPSAANQVVYPLDGVAPPGAGNRAAFPANPGTIFSACRSCGPTTWKSTVGATRCSTCSEYLANTVAVPTVVNDTNSNVHQGSTYNTPGVTDPSTLCFCAPGYFMQGGVCVQCGTDTFKSVAGNSACTTCPSGPWTATTPVGSTSCSCASGAFPDASGNCLKPVTWNVPDWSLSTCSKLCDGGVQTRVINTCTDVNSGTPNTNVPEATCIARGVGAKPATSQSCNTQACTTYGYIPTFYDSGFVNGTILKFSNIPRANSPLTYTWTPSGASSTVSATNPLAIHVSIDFPAQLQTLRLVISHAGVSVTLFELDELVSCMTGSATSTQLVFTDAATIPALRCNANNQLTFRSGQSYIVKPLSALAAFDGYTTGGDWVLQAFTIPDRGELSASQLARVISWGITLKPTVCPINSYIPFNINSGAFNSASSTLTGTCVPCPAHSLAVDSGVNGIHSCPCAAGYLLNSASGYTCDACPPRTIRLIATNVAPFFQHSLSSLGSCTPCNGAAVNGSYCDPALCDVGYEWVGPTCQACGAGKFKAVVSAAPCSLCPAGFFSTSTGLTSASQCSPCGPNAVSNPTATACVCKPLYTDYAPALDGSGCSLTRSYSYVDSPTCSKNCEKGIFPRVTSCTDSSGASWSTGCTSPAAPVVCNTQACAQYGYVPTYATGGYLNLPITTPLFQHLSQVKTVPGLLPVANNVLSVTVTVPASDSSLISNVNQLAVHFTGSYVGFLDTLTIQISHAGVTVTLFNLTAAGQQGICNGGILSGGFDGSSTYNSVQGSTQLIFTDEASQAWYPLSQVYACTPSNPLFYQAGHVYTVPPVSSLEAFWNLPAAGDYVISVFSTPNPENLPTANHLSRLLQSAGVSFRPTVCPADQYITGTSLSGSCAVCPPGSAPWPGAGVNTRCLCPVGTTWQNGACVACPAGTFKSVVGYNQCLPCAANATSAAGASSCSCKVNYADYSGSAAIDGSTCSSKRDWFNAPDWSAATCTSICDGGIATRLVQCRDQFGAVFATGCNAGTKPVADQSCNTQPCAAYGYVPSFSSGSGSPIAVIPTDGTAVTKSIVIPSTVTDVISPSNQLAVTFTANFPTSLNKLQVTLTQVESGATISLFNLGSTDCLGFIRRSQIVFTDQAPGQALTCDNDNLIQMHGNNTYTALPAQPFMTLNGLSVAGTWVLSVSMNPGSHFDLRGASASSFQFYSFGLTFGPTVCGVNSYVSGSDASANLFRTLKSPCTACPGNSTYVRHGLNTINDCPCAGGYDANIAYRCTACGLGNFREIALTSSAVYQQSQGASRCVACRSSTGSVVAGSNPSVCGTDCAAGYTYVGGSPCQACPIGSFKPTVGPDACTICSTVLVGSSTAAVASVAQSSCGCPPGFELSGGSCVACGAGKFKNTFGAGSCTSCTGSFSTPSADASKCVCQSTGYDSTPSGSVAPVDGSNCLALPMWKNLPAFPSCPADSCENVVQTTGVVCRDAADTTTLNDNVCLNTIGARIPASRNCNSFGTTCTTNGFVPQFSLGGSRTGVTVDSARPYSRTISGVTNAGTLSATNQVALHVTLGMATDLHLLRISLFHNGVTSGVFKLLSSVPCKAYTNTNIVTEALIPNFVQLVFADMASVPAPTCDSAALLSFTAESSTILRPSNPLSNLNGLPAAGDWTLLVSTTGSATVTIVNWGLTFNPTIAPDNSYLTGTSLTGSTFATCGASTTSLAVRGVNALTSCGCAPGTEMNLAGACTACGSGRFRSAYVLNRCLLCAANSIIASDKKSCACGSSFFDYTSFDPELPGALAPSGSTCTVIREWYYGPWSTCSTPCEYGTQTRDVYCTDPLVGGIFPDSHCAGAKPPTIQGCNTLQACVANGFMPTFSSGYINRQISAGSTTSSFSIRDDTLWTSSRPVITVSLNYRPASGGLNGLRIVASKVGATSASFTLIDMTPSTCGSGSYIDGAQLNFAAAAAADPLFSTASSCSTSTSGEATFRNGNAYFLRPASSFSSVPANFDYTGTWTLTVTTTNANSGLSIISWGVNNDHALCSGSTFLRPGGFNGTCFPAPGNTLTTFASSNGPNTVFNFPCADGFDFHDTTQRYVCTPCLANTFRTNTITAGSANPMYQLSIDQATCNACNRVSPAGSTSASACTGNCNAGFGVSNGVCSTCPADSFQDGTGVTCSTCGANSGTNGAVGQSACQCRPGFQGTSSCTACPANFVKSSFGAGPCTAVSSISPFATYVSSTTFGCLSGWSVQNGGCVATASNKFASSITFPSTTSPTIAPTFNSVNTFAYTVTVPITDSSIVVTVATFVSQSVVMMVGSTVVVNPVPLQTTGSTVITVSIGGASPVVYTLTVVKQPSSDATLTALAVQSSVQSTDVYPPLTPGPFASGVNEYTVYLPATYGGNVPNDVNLVCQKRVGQTITFTFTGNGAPTTLNCNGVIELTGLLAPQPGTTYDVLVNVVAPDASSNTYTLHIVTDSDIFFLIATSNDLTGSAADQQNQKDALIAALVSKSAGTTAANFIITAVQSGSTIYYITIDDGVNNRRALDVWNDISVADFSSYDSSSDFAIVLNDGSSDASLVNGGLSVVGYSFTPAFSPSTANYALTLPPAVSSISFSASVTNSFATVAWSLSNTNGVSNFVTFTSGSTVSVPNLVEGDNKVSIKVTAQNGESVSVYSITIHVPSTVATISNVFFGLTPNLANSVGTSVALLRPVTAWSPSVFDYEIIYTSRNPIINVRPLLTSSLATVKYGAIDVDPVLYLPLGARIDPATPSCPGYNNIPFYCNVGLNYPGGIPMPLSAITKHTVKFVVTAESGTVQKVYTVNITRLNDDSSLASLSGVVSAASYTPTVTTGTNSYTLLIPRGPLYTQVALTYAPNDVNATVTPSSGASFVSTGLNSILVNVGTAATTTVSLTVRATNGIDVTVYTVTIGRLSSDSTLTSLGASFEQDFTIYRPALTPAYTSNVFYYTLKVDTTVSTLHLTPIKSHPDAIISTRIVPPATPNFPFTVIDSGKPFGYSLAGAGHTYIEVLVLAPDLTTTTYYLDVFQISNVATLFNIVFSPSSIPIFYVPGTNTYSAIVPAAVGVVSYVVTPKIPGATVEKSFNNVAYTTIPDTSVSQSFNTPIGSVTTLYIRVTAVDGVTTELYQFTLTRPAYVYDDSVSFGACNSTCGIHGFQTRPANCVASGTHSVTDTNNCVVQNAPLITTIQPCNRDIPCTFFYFVHFADGAPVACSDNTQDCTANTEVLNQLVDCLERLSDGSAVSRPSRDANGKTLCEVNINAVCKSWTSRKCCEPAPAAVPSNCPFP